MRRLIVSGLAFAALSSAAFAQDASQLTGSQLREAVAGRTVYLSSPLGEVPIRYSSNGTMSGSSQLALIGGESTATDRGRWWVAKNRLCVKWQNWMHGRSYCFSMRKVGARQVVWLRNDGKTGRARLG
jgi:hypothetical protein